MTTEPAAAEPAAAEAVFAALADPTRRLILDRLSRRGDASATVLAEELPVTRQAVVKHLAVLDQAGLVTARRDGRERRYRVRPDGLEATARWMDGIAAQWAARLSTIKRLAERAEQT
jgi:DNA-binding transcriptional ArsR family regulator